MCPGWAAQSPVVAEIADAYTAMSAGALRDLFPDVTNVVAEGLLEMKRSLNQYEWVQSLALKKESEHG